MDNLSAHTYQQAAKALAKVILDSVGLYQENELEAELKRACRATDLHENEPNNARYIIETHKIDYRAAFSAYICKETFDVYDKFENQDQENDSNVEAEAKINQIYRELSSNPADIRRATEYLVHTQSEVLITIKSKQDEAPTAQQPTENIDSNYALNDDEWLPSQQGITWDIEDKHLPPVLHQHNVRVKVFLNSPVDKEILGTFNVYLQITPNEPSSLEQSCRRIRDVITANQDIIAQLRAAYAQVREYRRLALQNASRYKISRLFGELQEVPISEARQLTNEKERDLRLPMLETAVERALAFLGQYCQARHLLLLEVYRDENGYDVSIFRTWSTRFESFLAPDLLESLSLNTVSKSENKTSISLQSLSVLQAERQYLLKETEHLQRLANGFSVRKPKPIVDEDDLKAALSKFLQVDVFEHQPLQKYRHEIVEGSQFQRNDLLPAKLQLRALQPFINPSQALARKDTSTVNWYVAFVDRVDDVVEAGRLHRWGRCDSGTSFQKELTNIMIEMKREFSSYLRGYKDECIQYIWQHEYALQDGTGFSADDAKWLKWLQDFIAQCIEINKVHYVLPDYYFSAFYNNNKAVLGDNSNEKSQHAKTRKSKLPPCIDHEQVHIQSLTYFIAQVSADHAKTIQEPNEKLEDEWSVSNHLVLRQGRAGSELYITIGEKNRDHEKQERDLNAYTSHWAIVAVNDASRYSYLHIQFIKTFITEVARIRLRAIKNQLQQQLEVTFHSEDSINQAYNKFVPEPAENNSTKENRLANQILALIQTQFLKPFFGLDSPMLLVTQNTNKNPVHYVSNHLLDKQFEIDSESRFSFLKASLQHILHVFTQLSNLKGHEIESIDKLSEEYRLRDYQACEFTSEGSTLIRVLNSESSNTHAESTRGLETGRYSLACKLAFMPEQYFDGVILFVGRAEPFDKWACYCLAEISKAIIPALSVSFINQQSMTKLGLIQHALNSPAQGISSLAKESIRRCKNALNSFSLSNEKEEEKQSLIKQLNGIKDEINLLTSEIRSWKVALQAVEERSNVDISEKHDLVTDLQRWIKRFNSRASELDLELNVNIPFQNLYITYSPIHLDIAFSNLLDNALKYSVEKTTVEITLTLYGANVQIDVINTGAYISKESKNRILGFGQRDKSAVESAISGQGIGLPLVAKFVNDHPNGKLSVQSKAIKNFHSEYRVRKGIDTEIKIAQNTFSIQFSDANRTKLNVS